MAEADSADLGVGLGDLIDLVHRIHPDGDALTRLSGAILISDRLGELGDHLIGHFVDQARRAGASWREIGAGMGVSKQAVQKRFVPGAGDIPEGGWLSRFTPRARNSLATARSEARRMTNSQVGSEHLVLGLLAEKEGLAARAIAAQGVTAKQVRARIAAAGVPTAKSLPERIPFAPRAKKVLELAVREALRMEHNYIGTEHLLLGVLAADDSLGAKVLAEAGLDRHEVTAWITREIAAIIANKAAD